MIRAEQIPDEVVEVAARATYEDWRAGGRQLAPAFDDLMPFVQDDERKHARASIVAALNAWPEAKRVKGYFTHDTDYYEPAIILPLPQEVSDE